MRVSQLAIKSKSEQDPQPYRAPHTAARCSGLINSRCSCSSGFCSPGIFPLPPLPHPWAIPTPLPRCICSTVGVFGVNFCPRSVNLQREGLQKHPCSQAEPALISR